MRTEWEVADVLRQVGKGIGTIGLNSHQLRMLRAIEWCRTPSLGGHVDGCTSCGHIRVSYNSCRNRHCPKCQGHKREEWIGQRAAELLPVPYFHVVFTLPDLLNGLAMHKPKEAYDCLFAAAWQTINAFAGNKGLQAGMISVLHTWGQTLSLHPHLHCIVPGAGACPKGTLQRFTAQGKYLFPVKALSKVFRAKYVEQLRQKNIGDKALYNNLFKKEWVVYAKRPFGGPGSVIEYLGRYTHKVAISNNRLQKVDEVQTTFYYKDYRHGAKRKSLVLENSEFVRRFAMHILPLRFVRIRHYGMLSSTWKRKKLKEMRQMLKLPMIRSQTKTMLHKCPCCKTGVMVTIEVFGKRGPPESCFIAQPQNAC